MPTSKPKAALLTMPREHGFWIMLVAALLSSAGRSDWQLVPSVVALLAGLVAIAGAALLHKAIRRLEWAQLVASSTLALLVIPGELLSGMSASQVAHNVIAWASVFTGASLMVRAVFARARRSGGHGWWQTMASVLSPLVAALALYLAGEGPALRIAAVGTVGMLILAAWRPVPKQLKISGLVLARIVVVALAAELSA